MNQGIFRPQEVHAEGLTLVGYRLYPCTGIELHPRLTLLAGANGVGKTTLLDAIQTILIADKRSLHLNVASGQNDRDLGGQLQERVAWAALALSGHPEIKGVGVCLARRAMAEYVDIKPFALIGVHPDRDLFLDRETSKLAADLKALNQNVASRAPGARVKEFSTVSDYHHFLNDEGLLPWDLSKGGRRQFSLLWRQATQPHLGELNAFLQQALCHEPEKKLTFQDVERLMQERLHTERQLGRLGELKQLTVELKARARDVDHHRRRYLGINLGQTLDRTQTLERDIEDGEKNFQQLDERLTALKEELGGMRASLERLSGERDKYLREQGEWSRKYKHHQDYLKNRQLISELEEKLASAETDVAPIESGLEPTQDQIEKIRLELQTVSNELALLRGRESDLEGRLRKWWEFNGELERAGAALDEEIKSSSDLERVWSRVNEERRRVQEIKPLRHLHSELTSRAKAHGAAVELSGKVTALWPEFFDGKRMERTLLDEALAELRSHEKTLTLRREELKKEKSPLTALIDELAKGRLPLPRAAGRLVEDKLASPFTKHFDDLGLESAGECQERIGPLAYAVEPASGAALSQLATGREPFLLVLSPDVVKKLHVLERTEHGTISGLEEVAWYTPGGPVWIGAEARRQQIQKAQARLLEIGVEIKDLFNQEDLIARRRQAIQDLLPKVDALMDTEAPGKARELAATLDELQPLSVRTERLYPMVQKLFQKSELFSFVQSPEEMGQLKARIDELQERYGGLEKQLKESKREQEERSKTLASLKGRIVAVQRELDKAGAVSSRLEEEEPKEVLEGQVDFGRSEELQKRVQELEAEKEKVQNGLFAGERKGGELRNRYRTQSEALVRLKRDLDRARMDHQRALTLWKGSYPEEEPQYISGSRIDERERHKVAWESLNESLRSRIEEVVEKYGLQPARGDQSDLQVARLLQLLLPPGVELDQLEEQYSRLQRELQQIEYKIKSHVEEIRSNVETEIRRLKVRLAKVNRILSTLRFGKIKKICLELEELPAYHALQKLESLLSTLNRSEAMTLREFVDKLRAFIHKESNTALSEEQIADYRSYIRIRRLIIDSTDKLRETGLSSGETLGVNFALCLAILFLMGREQGVNRERGMLLLALDEAERLDAQALETVRDLLDEVKCQLIVAMPRPVDIPDSNCHLLTPLPQGVTHVHLYYKGTGNGREIVA